MKIPIKNRKYHMTDAELAQFCDKVVLLITRDTAEFSKWNISSDLLNAFKIKINDFKNFDTDEYFEGVRMEKTEKKYAARNELVDAINPVRDRIRLEFGEYSALYRSLRITDIAHMPDENMVYTAKRTLSIAHTRKDLLTAWGLTDDMLTACSAALLNFDQAIDAVEESNILRDERTEARIDLGNELYAQAVSLSTIGKSMWYSRSEAKFNDYIIYIPIAGKTTLTGKITDQASGKPLVGALVKLRGVEVIQKTDEQGNYIFTNLEPGVYTLTVTADGYNEFTKEGIKLRKGERVKEDVEMVGVE